MSVDDIKKLKNIVDFDESDPSQFTQKILFICGTCFGFRGGNEHVLLKTEHLRTGLYSDNHEFYGYRWIGFGGMADKTCKLLLTTSYLRDDEHLRITILTKNPFLITVVPFLVTHYVGNPDKLGSTPKH